MINSQNFYAGKEIRAVCLQGGGEPQVEGEVTGAYVGRGGRVMVFIFVRNLE